MPKVVVLMIGTNNLYDDFNGNATAEEIAKGIKTILERIRNKLPQTRIILLGILPRESHWYTDIIEDINAIIESYHDNNWIYYLDMNWEFESEPGFVNKELYLSELQLSKSGYALWQRLMEHLLSHLIDPKEEGDITHSPPTHDKPWVATYGWWGPGISYKFTHENLVHQSRELKDKIKGVFVGDSNTMNWATDGEICIFDITLNFICDIFPSNWNN